jgi:hypothetical protein
MPGQHDTTPIQTVIYKPNEHADEYIVAIDDVAEVSPSFYPLTIFPSHLIHSLALLNSQDYANN